MSFPQDRSQGGEPPDEPTTLPVVEESLDVEIRERSTGQVRVRTRTESVERLVEETLSSVTASVTRVPVGRELERGESPPETRTEAGTTIVPVLEERLFVEKRLVLVEEIRIEQRSESEAVSVPVSLRRQRVELERLPGDSSDAHPSDSNPTTES